MDIELLYVPECPNLGVARLRLHQALEATGVLGTIRETEVSTPEAAAALGLRGSPTILLDGHDPFDSRGAGTSVSCRLYPVDGSLDGAPSVDQLVAALRRG